MQALGPWEIVALPRSADFRSVLIRLPVLVDGLFGFGAGKFTIDEEILSAYGEDRLDREVQVFLDYVRGRRKTAPDLIVSEILLPDELAAKIKDAAVRYLKGEGTDEPVTYLGQEE